MEYDLIQATYIELQHSNDIKLNNRNCLILAILINNDYRYLTKHEIAKMYDLVVKHREIPKIPKNKRISEFAAIDSTLSACLSKINYELTNSDAIDYILINKNSLGYRVIPKDQVQIL